jgi:hypothetical protein
VIIFFWRRRLSVRQQARRDLAIRAAERRIIARRDSPSFGRSLAAQWAVMAVFLIGGAVAVASTASSQPAAQSAPTTTTTTYPGCTSQQMTAWLAQGRGAPDLNNYLAAGESIAIPPIVAPLTWCEVTPAEATPTTEAGK